jgi:hypothetical protein
VQGRSHDAIGDRGRRPVLGTVVTVLPEMVYVPLSESTIGVCSAVQEQPADPVQVADSNVPDPCSELATVEQETPFK